MGGVSSEEAFEQIFGALFAATGAVAGQLPAIASSPEAQGGLAVVLPALGFAVGRGVHRTLITRRASFAEGYVNAFGGDPVKAKAHADANRENEELNETMFRAFRMMMDATHPSVVPALGYLAGHYNYAGKAPDGFFRGLGRLLCDLDTGDLGYLQRLFRVVEQIATEWQVKESIFVGLRPGTFMLIVVHGDRVRELGAPGEAVKLFQLLRREGFTMATFADVSASDPEAPSGDYAAVIPMFTLRSILAIIDPRSV